MGKGSNYTTLDGVLTFYDCPGLALSSFYGNRIVANDCDDGNFYSDISSISSQTCLTLYWSSNTQQHGTLCNGSAGMRTYSSDVYVQSDGYYSSNDIGISATDASDVIVNGAKFCESLDYDLYSNPGAYIMAQNAYYHNGIPRYVELRGGVVDIWGTTNNCNQLAVSDPNNKENNFIQTSQTKNSRMEFSELNNNFFNLIKEIKSENATNIKTVPDKYYNDYIQVIDKMINYAKKYPDYSLAKTALTTAVNSLERFSYYDKVRKILDEIISDNDLVELKGKAERLLINYYKGIKEYDNAVERADRIAKEYGNDELLVCDALYIKGLIQSYNLNKPEEAAECFSHILQKYPKNNLASLAENELRILGETVGKQFITENKDKTEELILENYPNPFNPTTTIVVSLPQQDNIKLVVYDVLGREVIKLADGNFKAGRHDFTFNAANLPSGVYFYNIQTSGQSISKKMLLLK